MNKLKYERKGTVITHYDEDGNKIKSQDLSTLNMARKESHRLQCAENPSLGHKMLGRGSLRLVK